MEFRNVTESGVVIFPTPDEAPGIVHAIREVCRARGLSIYPPALEKGEDGSSFVNLQFVEEYENLLTVGMFCKALKGYSITPPQFMVTVTNARGRIHLDPMRFFTGPRAEFEARDYVASIPREDGEAVMYEVSRNSPPKKVKGVYQGRMSRGT